MPLSVVTDEIDEDLRKALEVCADLGISAVELRSVDGRNIVEHDPGSLAGIQRLIAERGAHVCAIASPFLKCDATVDPAQPWRDAIAVESGIRLS